MKLQKKHHTVRVLFACISTASSTTALATADNDHTNFCFGSGNIICISETNNPALSAEHERPLSYYTITNNGPQRIYGFGVTNTVATNAFVTENLDRGWDAKTFSVEEWDSGASTFDFFTSGNEKIGHWETGARTNDRPGGLGSFKELFGATKNEQGEDLYVNFYWNDVPSHFLDQGFTASGAGSPWRGNFYFNGLPASEAITFNLDGNIIGGTHTNSLVLPDITPTPLTPDGSVSAVPEPSTYAMLVVGLGLLGFSARRNKQA